MNELRGTEINIDYGIDKNINLIDSNIELFSMEDKLREVDVVVVTAITFFEEIKKELSENIECPIVSLEDIIYEVLQ